MMALLESFATHFSYLGIAVWLTLGGLGLPIPEDVPLVLAGFLCRQNYAHIGLMLPWCMLFIVGADCLVFSLGRRYGHRVSRLPLLRRYLTPQRLEKARAAFHRHGGKTLFVARFMPGMRTAIFFSAGTFGVPLWKMVVFDGSAALLSVPALVLAGRYFPMELVLQWAHEGQLLVFLALALVVGLAFAVKLLRARRRRAAQAGT